MGNEQYDGGSGRVFTEGGYIHGGGHLGNYVANAILSGGVDSNVATYISGTGNAVPLSYANTSAVGNANIIAELTGAPGNLVVGGVANVGFGGVDFIFDFTGTNVSYSGGSAGEGSNPQNTTARPLYFTGKGAGGTIHTGVNTPGANGVVMLRHLQNGTRSLSM